MKTLLTAAFSLTLASLALSAQASTIQLSPTVVSVAPGQVVTFSVSVDPASATVFTVKTQIAYSADLLTPTSFSFGPGWMQLSQSGYDQMSGGVVIKTGGYPNGFSTLKGMGTLTFTAKAAGIATITVQNASLALNDGNQNTLTGVQGASQIRIAPVAPGVVAGSQTATTQTTWQVTESATSTESATTSANDQAAAVATANIPGAGAIPTWAWALLAIAVVASGGFAWWSNRGTVK